MGKTRFVIEGCCNAYRDTIHSYETTHVSLDTSISLELLDKTQQYAENALGKANEFYNRAFENLVSSQGNYLTVICIAIAVFAFLFFSFEEIY